MPNYNAPEFANAVNGETMFKVGQVVNRFNKVAKLVALKQMDPSAKVAAADVAAVEQTSLPVVCLAVAAMNKVASKEVTAANAYALYPKLAVQSPEEIVIQAQKQMTQATQAQQLASLGIDPGVAFLPEQADPSMLERLQAGVAEHPYLAGGAALGGLGLAGLGAAQAMRGHKKK
jgi:hypothetical protein